MIVAVPRRFFGPIINEGATELRCQFLRRFGLRSHLGRQCSQIAWVAAWYSLPLPMDRLVPNRPDWGCSAAVIASLTSDNCILFSRAGGTGRNGATRFIIRARCSRPVAFRLNTLVAPVATGLQRSGVCWITAGSRLIPPARRRLISGSNSERRQWIPLHHGHVERRQLLSVNRRRKRLTRVNLRRRIVLRQRLTAEADHYCRDHTPCAQNHSPPPVRRFANEVSYESGRIQDISRKKFTKELMLPGRLGQRHGPSGRRSRFCGLEE